MSGEAASEAREALLAKLLDFNALNAAPANAKGICLALYTADDQVSGGLIGTTAHDWLGIELLFIPAEMRGQGVGSRLMGQAEEEAKARGCIGAWLDTFSFQARGFYEKLGYSLAGTIPDHPVGGARYFMMKRWD